jgi:hypothetical protein
MLKDPYLKKRKARFIVYTAKVKFKRLAIGDFRAFESYLVP